MRILVTGGAGFLGSSLVSFLLRKHPDYSVMVLDSLVEGALDNLDEEILDNHNFSFWQGDIRDGNLVNNLVRNSDIVVNLAARTDAGLPPDISAPFVDENIKGTAVLLESARLSLPAKFIHVSASEVYGPSRTQPVTEEHPMMPQTLYGGSKAAADTLVLSFFASCRVPSVILRPFNVYGPGQKPLNMVPLFITSGIQDKPVPIHGDGNSTGDWMFVEDFCGAVDKTIHADADELAGEIINIGTGREKSINQVAGHILDLLGKSEGLISFVEDKHGLPRHMVSSVSKAELLLGWEPSVDFRHGMDLTVNWYLENQQWWRRRSR